MAGAVITVGYSSPLDAASGNIAPGMCILANSAGNYVPATLANRLANPGVGLEVSLTAASTGSVRSISLGKIPPSEFNLGAGAAATVGPNDTTGMLMRSAPTSVGTCDTAGTCTIGNVGTIAAAPDPKVFSVKTYGAIGDGVADDTASIQLALTAGAGQSVYFPGGTYVVSAPLTFATGTRISGAGASVSKILQTGITKVGAAVIGGYYVLTGSGVSGVTICDVGFVGQNSPFYQTLLSDQNGQGAVEVRAYSSDVTIERCRFDNLFGNLARSGSGGPGTYTRFLNNVANQCGGEVNFQDEGTVIDGNVLTQCWAIEAANQSTRITNNVMRSCHAGIALGGNYGYRNYKREDVGSIVTGASNATPIVITANNHNLVAGDGVQVSGVVGNEAANRKGYVGTVIDANNFQLLTLTGANTVGSGVYVSGGALTFNGDFGCVVAGNIIDTTVAGGGIIIGEPQVGAIIANNNISRIGGSYHGIQITAQAYFADCARCIQILDNTIEAVTGEGIYLTSGDGHVIRGNRILGAAMPDGTFSMVAGIICQNAFGNVRNMVIEGNQVAAGSSGAIVIDGLKNLIFKGNRGQLIVQNSYGQATFDVYEPTPEGVVLQGGASPAFPATNAGIVFASDANKTLTEAQYAQPTWNVSGTISVTRDLIAPLRQCTRLVANGAKDGGGTSQAVRVIGASGTGATVAAGKNALVFCDGTNWNLGPST